MHALEKINLYLNRYLLVVGGIAVLALMALATGNVVLRLFQMPYAGTYEFVSFLGAIVTASALGYTQMKKDHIVVDILTDRYPEPLKSVTEALSSLISFIFFAIVSWQMFVWGMKLAESGELSETLKVVYHPYVYCVAAGFAMLSLTCAIDVTAILRKPSQVPAGEEAAMQQSGLSFSESPKEERT
jgi:TRAP-type C4-dicarboxylate transport system permease small subunit